MNRIFYLHSLALLLFFTSPACGSAVDEAPAELPPSTSTVGRAAIRDMVLIYDSYWTYRPDWNGEMFEPYVSSALPDGSHQWLFDGFLFIEFTDGPRQFCSGYGRANARKEEWIKLVEHQLFSEGLSMQALDARIEKVKPLAPDHGRRKVVMTLPEPIFRQEDWGELNGKALNFSDNDDRIAACCWYVDHVVDRYLEAGLKNLQLAGFYWVAEAVGESRAVVRAVADHVHSRNLNFYWIPYFNATGYSQWADFGFDEAWLQPNYFFSETVPLWRLDEACLIADQYRMSNEFEFDKDALAGNGKRQRMIDYIDAFTRHGVFRDKNIAYYEGGGDLYKLRYGAEQDFALYRQLTDTVAERQRRFYESTFN
ncbi:MAG: DUF4855 domain-containing protein [Tannerella sp.]|jgi:hypothetical protein|nr:DUF4855 domain-containing protein [Tannerella sp.]